MAKIEILKNYHLHIYKTSLMKEVDVRATDECSAKAEALKLVAKKPFRKSDCKFIAINLGEK